MDTAYQFNLPPEENGIRRNRTITTYYAQLYQRKPQLYKWAGMAAFASFHIGEKLRMWNWKKSGIKSLSATCKKQNRTLEDDFQVIRIINNTIFLEIGWAHLAFAQLDFETFKSELLIRGKDKIIIDAFEQLNSCRAVLHNKEQAAAINEEIWEANIAILWHEQSKVVQPLFDKLSDLFSRAMSFFASFDYKINHHKTTWKMSSRFFFFMIFNGLHLINNTHYIPKVTNLQQRWFWIMNDLLLKWKRVETNNELIAEEIEILAQIEERNLIM
ncbi:DUF2515 family protein [Kordia jejudonensis]|uniref:DUF2515 family protein n=1 Tax=Kordia jejudonensis TaxID=1348245 RepID=UPI0006298A0F|nr:hypothetical protein [Kordia jejudonensis]